MTKESKSWGGLDQEGFLQVLQEKERRIQELQKQLAEAQREAEFYKNLSFVDRLTGLYNKLWLLGNKETEPPIESELDKLFASVKRYDQPLSAVMFDLDHFKEYNDTYGHIKADNLLEQVGKIVRTVVRESDFGVRYGGDEFLLLLPQTNISGAKTLAERLRLTIKEKTGTTISCGISSYPFSDVTTSADLLRAADAALYFSKNSGKNITSIYWQ